MYENKIDQKSSVDNKALQQRKNTDWHTFVEGMHKFPAKAFFTLSMGLGAFIVVAYYVHIEYPPNLEAVNIPFLFGQAFYAGLLTCLIFACLFVTVFFASQFLPSDTEHKGKSGQAIRFLCLVELALAHFPIVLFIYSQHQKSLSENTFLQNWWPLLLWGAVFASTSITKHVLIAKRRNQCDTVHTSAHDVRDVEPVLPLPAGAAATHANSGGNAPASGPIKKALHTLFFYGKDLARLALIAAMSAFPFYVLMLIVSDAPIAAEISTGSLLQLWAFIACMSAIFSIAPGVPLGQRLFVACGVIFVVLSYTRLTHLPLVLAARMAGIGQIEHVDLELPQTRCDTVRRQLEGAGIVDRLSCPGAKASAKPRSDQSKTTSASFASPGVLKDVRILNRVGTELYVEIPRVSASSLPVAAQQRGDLRRPAASASPTQTKRVENEYVVRLRIPKQEANELVYTTRPVTSKAPLH